MQLQTWQDYLEFTRTTAVYPKDNELGYLMFGIIDELEEFKEKVEESDSEGYNIKEFVDELGDVCWYTARLTDHFEM